MNLRAVIFDMNGTLLSDEDEYGLAFKKVLESLGAKVSSNAPQTRGIGVAENWQVLPQKYAVEIDRPIEELVSMTQKAYLDMFDKVTLRGGFFDLVGELSDSGVLVALATSNTYPLAEKVIKKFNLENVFDVVTTREEVNLSKPSPEIFMTTADKLSVEYETCVVIEDSLAGIEAARTAKMKTVGIAETNQRRKIMALADKVITDFSQISVDDLKIL